MTKIWILLSVIVLLVACNENFNYYYDDYSALRKDDIKERGWIPDFLPTNSEKIYEVYNIDINTIYGKFTYKNELWIDSLKLKSYEYQSDSLIQRIAQINRPRRPKWFITDTEISKKDLLIIKTPDWVIIADTLNNECYYIK